VIGTVKVTTGLDSVIWMKVQVVLTQDAIIEVTAATRRAADGAESSDRVAVPFTYSPEFSIHHDMRCTMMSP
jgi:hypothetical protein